MFKLLKNLIPILAVFLMQTAYSQTSVNQGLIGQNYWLNVGQVWDQVTDMKTEIMRVGGIEFNSNYYGTAWYDATLDNIENSGAEPMIQISEQWSDTQRKALLQHFVDNNRDIKYFAIGNEPDHNNRVPDVNTIIEYYNRIGPQIREYYPPQSGKMSLLLN